MIDVSTWPVVECEGIRYAVARTYIPGVSLREAKDLATAAGCTLPSPALVDAIYKAADCKLDAVRFGRTDHDGTMATMAAPKLLASQAARIADAIQMWEQRARRPAVLVAGTHKDVIEWLGRLGIYGWQRLSGTLVQGPVPSFRHVEGWKDYSQGARLVRALGPVVGYDGDMTPPAVPPPTLRLGSTGEHVRRVQTVIGAKVDGKFGPATELLVKAWQRAKGLMPDGVFGAKSWAAFDATPDRPTVPDLSQLDPPRFWQAARYGKGRPYGMPSLIVLHTTEGGETIRSADNLASAWAVATKDFSAHYIVDPDGIIQAVSDNDRAWHTSGKLGGRFINDIAIGIEQCGTAKQTAAQWADEASVAELDLTARLLAQLSARYAIPLVRLTVADLKDGNVRGITGHVDCTKASGSGDHWDPGPNYPWDLVMALAVRYASL